MSAELSDRIDDECLALHVKPDVVARECNTVAAPVALVRRPGVFAQQPDERLALRVGPEFHNFSAPVL